ncbi:MAG: hypothetical protein HQ559_04230 [Lentisphaerae bacterium]|nr:hypothetical protein [Lentisphaerota bacterium]
MKVAARILAYRISNEALASKDLPKRLKFLDWGENKTIPNRGRVSVSALTAESLPGFQEEKGWDRVALDYEHNTLPGTPAFKRSEEPRPVAAYGVVVCVAGDGVFLDDLQWTPHGEKFAREYIDLSPAPVQTTDGTVVGVHSVALCRHGSVDGLQFYSVDIPEGDNEMDWKKWLCGWLGKDAEATSDEAIGTAFQEKIVALCTDAIKPFSEKVAGLETTIAALSADVDPEKGGAIVTALSAEVETMKGQIVAFESATATRDRQDLVRQAAREGKVIPLSAEEIDGTAVPQLRGMIEKLPVTVPLDQRTSEAVALSADAAATGAVDVVARACGVDPKDVK